MAPLADNVTELPLQILVLVTTTVGVGFTVTVEVLLFVQIPDVPVTVYIVVDAGLTEIEAVVAPVFHVYEVAPEAVRTVDVPEQIVGEFTLTATVTTDMVNATVAVDPQYPSAVVEITEVDEILL